MRVVWCGDATASPFGVPSAPTGFERCTRHGAGALQEAGHEVHVLGINYTGDPHDYPFDVYPACRPLRREDAFGQQRMAWLVDRAKPDVVVLLNDPWNVPGYMESIRAADEDVPVIGWIAVDGKNCRADALEGLAHAVFWTDFAEREAREGGWEGPSSVVPLGVDLEVYGPRDRREALREIGQYDRLRDAFIVGVVARNQPRKRLDLTVSYFAEWMHSRDVEDAQLLMHVPPTGDTGWNLRQLGEHYGLTGHMMISTPKMDDSITEKDMPSIYSMMDVQVSTTQGEGFGLPVLEGMACGVPQIVPDWSALGDWPGDAAVRVPCSEVAHTPNFINVEGGIADRSAFIDSLDRVYRDADWRRELSRRGRELAVDPRFDWQRIGRSFSSVVEAHGTSVIPDLEVAV